MSNTRVLVVEDDYDSMQVVMQTLDHQGMKVDNAHNGQECLDMMARAMPDLVIVDLSMPIMDGWRTLAAIRANPATADIPVVAVTAYHSASVAEDARQAGFDAYFSKPLNLATFVKGLEEIIGTRGR